MYPFVKKFPKQGEKETRVVTVLSQEAGGPPPDQYGFVELFCEEKECDCRRVMISVLASRTNKIVATINMGFDSDDVDAGPFLDPLNPQSEYSRYFIEIFTDIINDDPAYLDRLQRHYVMFKEKMDRTPYKGKPFEEASTVKRVPGEPRPWKSPAPSGAPGKKIGRNQPCPCGSGKKYKKCCLLKSSSGPGKIVDKEETQKVTALKTKKNERSDLGMPFNEDDLRQAEELINTIVKRMNSMVEQDLFSGDIQRTLETKPSLTSALLHLLLKCHGGKNRQRDGDTHYRAIMTLLEEALTQLRYCVERGRTWAIAASETIQEEIAEKAFQLHVDVDVQADLMQALYSSKLELHSRIKEKNEEIAEHYNRFTLRSGSPNFKRIFDDLIKGGPQSPFELYELMMAELAALPAQALVGAAGEMIRSGSPLICEVALLLLLHPDPQVRKGVCGLFNEPENPGVIASKSFRRLIGLRNWLPKKERPSLDRLIKSVRLARIECAPMPRVTNREIYISPFDGAGMQAVWGLCLNNRKSQMSNVLVKQGEGIRETWVDPKFRKGEKKSLVARLVEKAASLKVKEDYLHLLVSHFIAVGHLKEAVPPPGLLLVAENLAGVYWPPKALDFQEQMKLLGEELDKSFTTLTVVDEILTASGSWPEMPFGESWFEDDSHVDDIVKKHVELPFGSSFSIGIAADVILEEILKEKRDLWGERLFWMALRSRLSIGKNRLPWQAFFIVARELLRGAPLEGIPLMQAVAERSVFSSLQRLREFPR